MTLTDLRIDELITHQHLALNEMIKIDIIYRRNK
jgi:hypothetical protein